MMQMYTTSSTTYGATASAVEFDTTKVKCGCSVAAQGNGFVLRRPGYYFVSFNGYGAATTEGTPLLVQLERNGSLLAEAATENSATTEGTLGFGTIVRVLPSCAAIDNTTSLVVKAQNGTLALANIAIWRLS